MNESSAGTRVFSEFFDAENVDAQMSRHRFVMRGVPGETARWERCKAEFRRIKNACAAEDAANGVLSSSHSGVNGGAAK